MSASIALPDMECGQCHRSQPATCFSVRHDKNGMPRRRRTCKRCRAVRAASSGAVRLAAVKPCKFCALCALCALCGALPWRVEGATCLRCGLEAAEEPPVVAVL